MRLNNCWSIYIYYFTSLLYSLLLRSNIAHESLANGTLLRQTDSCTVECEKVIWLAHSRPN
jgi:hypothetical protein